MEWQELLIKIFERVLYDMEKALTGLSQADLNELPDPDCNSMGWLAWHLLRTQDKSIADLTGEQQVWMKDGWYTKFNREPDTADTGLFHKSEDVAAFKSPDVATVLEYHRAVLEQTKRYLSSLSTSELGREFNHPRFRTVGERLAAVINDNVQHEGQIAYLRGMLKGKGWLEV